MSTSWDVLPCNCRSYVFGTFVNNDDSTSRRVIGCDVFVHCRVSCLKKREARKKAIVELEKEISKSSKSNAYYDTFRSTARDAKASMDLVETYKVHEVDTVLFENEMFEMIMKLQGDSRNIDFVTRCMTTKSGVRVRAQLILSDPPGKNRLVRIRGDRYVFLYFREHCFEAGKQQQDYRKRCLHP